MANRTARKPRSERSRRESINKDSTTNIEVDETLLPNGSRVGTTNNTNNTNERQGTKMAGGLSPEQITALLGASRTKGVYIAKLTEFMGSGEQGVDVAEQWPELAEKQASTVKQGFENAKNSKNAPAGVDNVRVITNEEKVYLINTGTPPEAAQE